MYLPTLSLAGGRAALHIPTVIIGAGEADGADGSRAHDVAHPGERVQVRDLQDQQGVARGEEEVLRAAQARAARRGDPALGALHADGAPRAGK